MRQLGILNTSQVNSTRLYVTAACGTEAAEKPSESTLYAQEQQKITLFMTLPAAGLLCLVCRIGEMFPKSL
jgi:hypothetical protein